MTVSDLEAPAGEVVDDIIARAFAEDVGDGDITTLACVSADARISARMRARQPLTLAGVMLAEAAFRALDAKVLITREAEDGESLETGETILKIAGPARAILTAERTALNLVQHLSGIATLVRTYVLAIDGTSAKILDTRKTIPGLRRFGKYACACGGAQNHRMGLYDAVMIKDNHIVAAGSISKAVKQAHDAGHKKVQVECDTPSQVAEALTAGATSLLLDNMTVATLREVVARVDGAVPLEASGGVTLNTVRSIAETGVDFISVGRLTQSAPAVDIGLDFTS
ncbi:MAG: carboxylating nicotinate-nucleotide diphosphorylase [Pseudomonadota bacterium]